MEDTSSVIDVEKGYAKTGEKESEEKKSRYYKERFK